jgi:hypothetical protein
MIRGANLGIAFLLELAVLFAVGYWGFRLSVGLPLRLVAGLGTPVLMAVLWDSSRHRRHPSRFMEWSMWRS